MATFQMEIANKIIEVHALFETTEEFCRDFITEGEPDFTVTVTPEDIRQEKRRFDESNAAGENKTTDNGMEVLVLHRKIARQMLEYDTLLFHGAALCYEDQAYIFAAGSGTGKTTHSRLWLRYIKGARMLNGDKPMLQIRDGAVYCCGTPWRGKESYGGNEVRPLKAIVFLKRSPTNYIEKISSSEAFPEMIRQAYRPPDGNLSKAVSLISQMGKSVEYYRLSCNMTVGALQTSFETLTNKKLKDSLWETYEMK